MTPISLPSLWESYAGLMKDYRLTNFPPVKGLDVNCNQHYGYAGNVTGGHRAYIGATLWALLKSLYRMHVPLPYQKYWPWLMYSFAMGPEVVSMI